jgi:hypothetical protein
MDDYHFGYKQKFLKTPLELQAKKNLHQKSYTHVNCLPSGQTQQNYLDG